MEDEQLRRNRQRRMEHRKRQQRKRQLRNRILIVAVGVLILVLIIWGIASCASSGSDKNKNANTSSTTTAAQITAPPVTQPPTEVIPAIADNGQDGVVTDSGIYLWNNQGYELFSGTEESAKNYALAISGYKNQLGSEINVYNLVVPGHAEFGLPDRLKENAPTRSQKENTNSIYNSYSADVKAVDVYDTFNKHKNEYIYFNTDHHWTGLGAYYAYTEFARVAGFEPTEITDLTAHNIEGFLGSLYTATNDSSLAQNADTVTYYDIPGNYTTNILVAGDEELTEVGALNYSDVATDGAYSVFIWGDNPLTQVKHIDSNNDKKILVIKESYGNAFVPFLVNNYDEVHVIDFRHYSGNVKEYCTQNGIKEVLFLNGIMSANNAMQIDSMNTLF